MVDLLDRHWADVFSLNPDVRDKRAVRDAIRVLSDLLREWRDEPFEKRTTRDKLRFVEAAEKVYQLATADTGVKVPVGPARMWFYKWRGALQKSS